MDSKIAVPVIISLIIGGVLGGVGSYRYYTPIIIEYISVISDQASEISKLVADTESLNMRHDRLESDYNSLSDQHTVLNDNYESLEAEHTILMNTYDTISDQYNDLIEDYQDLENEYDDLNRVRRTLETQYGTTLDRWDSLSEDVLNLKETIESQTDLETSFKNVLSESEVEKLATIVIDITDVDSTWDSYEAIYHYVNDNVDYAKDAEIYYISGYSFITIDGKEYLTGFSTRTSRNQIQKPYFTLEYEQGDCDDHAILIYAMIKYYLINIFGTNYLDYLMWIEFSDGEAHLAVLIPVLEGSMCILDSAGNYFTNRWGSIASKTVSNEFYEYENHWSDQGEITRIQLYKVDVSDGDYTVVADGTIEEIITFLES